MQRKEISVETIVNSQHYDNVIKKLTQEYQNTKLRPEDPKTVIEDNR